MSTEQAYLQAVRDFVQALGADASGFDEGAEVSFEHDGLFAFIFLHPLEDRAVIDVEIFKLQDAGSEPAQRERLLLLHQLNSITRFNHKWCICNLFITGTCKLSGNSCKFERIDLSSYTYNHRFRSFL